MCQRAPNRRRPCDRSIGGSEKSITNAYRLPSTADTCPAPDRTSLSAAASDHPTARCRSPDRRRTRRSAIRRAIPVDTDTRGRVLPHWLFASLAIDPYQRSAGGRMTDGNVGESPIAGHVRILRAMCRRSEVADQRDRRAHGAQRLWIESDGAKRPGCRVDDVGRRHEVRMASAAQQGPCRSGRFDKSDVGLVASSRSRDREEDLACRERSPAADGTRSPPHRGPGASNTCGCAAPRAGYLDRSHPHRSAAKTIVVAQPHVRPRGPKAARVTDVAGPARSKEPVFKPSLGHRATQSHSTIRRKHRMPRRSRTGEDERAQADRAPGTTTVPPPLTHATRLPSGRNRDILRVTPSSRSARFAGRHDRQPA